MTNLPNSEKQVGILILIFILINTIFLSGVTLLPFIDLPNHLAEATIYKFYEPGNLLSQFYKPTPWYYPNSFHTVFCSLFPDVEWGNKIFHVLYIIALQGSMFLAIRQLKGNAWYGLLAILFTYNYNVSFGFVGFAISIPTLVLLFYIILRYIESDKMYLNVVIAVLLILLYLMHAQNALLGLLIYGFMMLYHHRKSFRKFIAHSLLVPLPLVILIITWWFTRDDENEGSTFEYLFQYYTNEYFQDFLVRFGIIVFDNFQLFEGTTGLVIASLFSLCILIPLFWLAPWRKQSRPIILTPEIIYAGIFFLITMCCYLFVPDKLPGQTPIFQRFCTIVMLSFLILGSILMNKVKLPWLKYFVILSCITYTLLWFEYIFTFNRENKTFNRELFAGMDPGSRLAGLIYDNSYRGRKVYIHFPSYYITWEQGIAASKIIDYRFGVVRRVASESELPFYHELIGESYSYQPQYGDIDYLLVRGTPPVNVDLNLQGFLLKKQAGLWKLHQNKR